METNKQSTLADAMVTLSKMPKIDIKGKQYASVASRVEAFRTHFPTASIETVIIHDDAQRVVMQANIRIGDDLISTGYAEEFRGEGWINTTSALENAETSAIGRSLSAFGLSGSEYASANEVSNAVNQQQHQQQTKVEPQNNSQSQYNQTPNNQVQNNTPQDYSSLYNIGLSILEQGSNLVVTGDEIFSKKDSIKACGFRWNGEFWWKPIQQQAA